MNNDYLDPINAEGMPQLADAALALDFLMSAKIGVRNYAAAIAETATPSVRAVLTRHLAAGLAMHHEIATLMRNKGWLHAHKLSEQFALDMTSADTVVKIANMNLFPGDTSRLGNFATPNK